MYNCSAHGSFPHGWQACGVGGAQYSRLENRWNPEARVSAWKPGHMLELNPQWLQVQLLNPLPPKNIDIAHSARLLPKSKGERSRLSVERNHKNSEKRNVLWPFIKNILYVKITGQEDVGAGKNILHHTVTYFDCFTM